MLKSNKVSKEFAEVMTFARNAPTFAINGKTSEERRAQMMRAMLDDEDTEGSVLEKHSYHCG